MKLEDCNFALETLGLTVKSLQTHTLDTDLPEFQANLLEQLTRVHGALLREKEILLRRQERFMADGMSRSRGIEPGLVKGAKVNWG